MTKAWKQMEAVVRKFRADDPKRFRLAQVGPADTAHLESKNDAQELLEDGVRRLSRAQERLYAQDRWSVLLIIQAMDAAGKDGTIRHVFSGVNPQGCQVYAFKVPSAEELDHDFLWRTSCRLPERGRIGIFNRSYYEELLIVRVHPEILAGQRIPPSLVGKRVWDERFEDINAFERYLSRQGTVILKFFLHVSKEEQARRFLERLDQPEKSWKFSMGDVREREHWSQYMAAYEDVLRRTSKPWAPWYVIPADHKWFTRVAVSSAIVSALEALDLTLPAPGPAKREELAEARAILTKASGGKRRRSR